MTDILQLTVPPETAARLASALRGLDAQGCTLAFAESCTAGLCASAVAGIEGLGHVLCAAFVTYSNAAKSRLLDVPRDVIEREGAVSEAVARLMAENALARSGADVAVSITGFAGPAGPADEEGRVHFALATTGRPTSHRLERFGPRGDSAVRLAALETVVEMLLEDGGSS